MVKSKFLLFTFVLISTSPFLMGQSVFKMDLSSHKTEVEDRMFFVDKVIDQRETKESIGLAILYQDGMVNWQDVMFDPSCETYLSSYFSKELSDEGIGQMGISIYVNKLTIRDLMYNQDTLAILELEVDYYYGDAKLFSDQRTLEKPSQIGTLLAHEHNIIEAFQASLIAFDTFDWPTAILDIQKNESNLESTSKEAQKMESPETKEEIYTIDEPNEPYDLESENRNVFTVGYRIGGYTSVGANYEFRVSDSFGVHAGAGFSGFTFGTKIHFNAEKNSSFINLSYKDAGFGILNAIAAEYGGRWYLSGDSEIGIIYQVGIGLIQHVDDDFEQQFFNGEAPSIMPSFGVGLSW